MTQGNSYWLSVYCFLWTDTMFPFFRSSGKILDFKQFLNLIESGFVMNGLVSFIILIENYRINELCLHLMIGLFSVVSPCQNWNHLACFLYDTYYILGEYYYFVVADSVCWKTRWISWWQTCKCKCFGNM